MRGGYQGPDGQRCDDCGLHLARCICAGLPLLEPSLTLAVVQHHDEGRKPTSTVRLLRKMIPSLRLAVWGARYESFAPGRICQEEDSPFLLFPDPDAPTLDASFLAGLEGRPVAVLVDGTWSQASHMLNRVPLLKGLPRVRVPVQGRGIWSARSTARPGALSTLEAAAWALRACGDELAASALLDALEQASLQLLKMRGTAPASRPGPSTDGQELSAGALDARERPDLGPLAQGATFGQCPDRLFA